MKITVILVTYNRANTFLKEAIEGVRNQTLKDMQIIIFDNASKDNTEDLVKKYMAIDERIKYVKNEINTRNDPNAYSKMLSIYDMCKTEYMLITHDDDIMEKQMLEKELNIIEKYNAIAVSCNAHVIDNNSKLIGESFGQDADDVMIFDKYEYIENYINPYGKNIYPLISTMLVKTNAFCNIAKKIDFTKTGAHSDFFQVIALNELGKITIIGEKLYRKRTHSLQGCFKTDEIFESKLKHILPYIRKYCSEVEYDNLVKTTQNKLSMALMNKEIRTKMQTVINMDINEIQKEFELKKQKTDLIMPYDQIVRFLFVIKYMKSKFKNNEVNYIIWGAGTGGEKTKYIINTLLPNMKCLGYIDSYQSGNKAGLNVYNKNEYNFNKNVCIVIGVTGAAYEISKFLEENGYDVLEDYFFGYGVE